MRARERVPEEMDQPGLDVGRHRRALRGLARVNRWSGVGRTLWNVVGRLAMEAEAPLRVLDLACGGGDVALELARRGRRAGVAVEIAGCDKSATAVEYADEQLRELGLDVSFFTLDVLRAPLPGGYDVLMSNLFLHHLEEGEAIELLRRMSAAARRAVVVDDLRRSRLGYLLAWVGTRLLSRSSIVHADGPRSVRAAFTVEEARALAERAGLRGVRVRRHWPFRYLLTADTR